MATLYRTGVLAANIVSSVRALLILTLITCQNNSRNTVQTLRAIFMSLTVQCQCPFVKNDFYVALLLVRFKTCVCVRIHGQSTYRVITALNI